MDVMLWGGAFGLVLAGVVLGFFRGSTEFSIGWAKLTAFLTFAVAVAAFWAVDQGGAAWLLLLPLALVAIVLVPALLVGIGFSVGVGCRHRQANVRWFGQSILPYLFLPVAVWLAYQAWGRVSRISDDAMIANFRRHESDFLRIVELAQGDRHLGRITPTFVHATIEGRSSASWDLRADMPLWRWNEYRLLFWRTGTQGGILRHSRGVSFHYWSTGLVTGGTEKGYEFRTDAPSPLVDSLEHIPFPVESLKPVYRRITDNWYLVYEWDD